MRNFLVGWALFLPAAVLAQPPDIEIRIDEIVASGFARPLYLTHAGDGSGRLFIVEQGGLIRIVEGNQVLPTPFLDVRSLVSSTGERGLLGLVFHPEYASNGLFYVNYTDLAGNTVLARYTVSAANSATADPASRVVLLGVPQPYANHNGGHLAFGPDGYLYVALGDGGSRNDPLNHAQKVTTLLGSLLRIDVDSGFPYAVPPDNPFVGGPGADPIWAYGLRNPWRFSFDRETGDLYIGDVGQGTWEEIDYQAAGTAGGLNFGWSVREGPCPLGQGTNCIPAPPAFTDPIAYYPRPLGASVTGGYVYRGERYPALRGRYFFADFVTGRLFSIYPTGGASFSPPALELATGFNVSSFGEDEAGELYVVEYGIGRIRRLADAVDAPEIVGSALPDGELGIPYDDGPAVAGGSPPYTFALVSGEGAIAPGLMGPDPQTGAFTGTPTMLGTFGPFRLRVTDTTGRFSEADLTHTIVLASPEPLAPIGAVSSVASFSWSSVPAATSYELVVESAGLGTILIDEIVAGTSFTPLETLPPGDYLWRVRAAMGSELSAFSSDVALEIDVVPPGATALTVARPFVYTPLSVSAHASSGDYNPTVYAKSRATDGNASTLWSSPARGVTQPEYLAVDLGGVAEVGRVRLTSVPGTGGTFPVDFTIQTSLDGQTYATVVAASDFQASAGTEYAFPIGPVPARYVRLLSSRVNVWTDGLFYTQLAEMAVDAADEIAGTLAIRFLAPGDDGSSGRAASYDLRTSFRPIAARNFRNATPVPTGAPRAAGSPEEVIVSSLLDERVYYYALVAVDDAGNRSPLTRARGTTRGFAPAPVTGLTAAGLSGQSVELSFVASDEDGSNPSGNAASAYEVRYATKPVTEVSFPLATAVSDPVPVPATPGTPQSVVVTGLEHTTTYFFGVRAVDELGNRSPLEVVSASTRDETPPSPVNDLEAFAGTFVEAAAPTSAVSSSGDITPAYGKSMAVDGDAATSWSTPGRTVPQLEQLTVDTGAPKLLSSVRLMARDVAFLFPEDYEIHVSDDGVDFTPVATAQGISLAPGATIEHRFDPVSGRFVRLHVTRARQYTDGRYYVQLAELLVFESILVAGDVSLTWTAPGNNGAVGTAFEYVLKRSRDPIEDQLDFEGAVTVPTSPPLPAGSQEELVIPGLAAGTRYYFRLVSRDEASNVSPLSNLAVVVTPGTPPP